MEKHVRHRLDHDEPAGSSLWWEGQRPIGTRRGHQPGKATAYTIAAGGDRR